MLIYEDRAINCIASEQPAQWLPRDVEADHRTFILNFVWSLPWRRAVEELRSILYRSASAVERGLDAPWPLLASKAIYRVQPFGLGSRKRSRLHCTAAGIDWLRRKRYSRLQSAEFGSHLLVKKNNVLGTVVPKACQDFFRGSSSRRRWCPKLRSKSVNQGNSNIKFILLSAAEIERLVENPAPLCTAIFLFTCKIWCRQGQMWNCKFRVTDLVWIVYKASVGGCTKASGGNWFGSLSWS